MSSRIQVPLTAFKAKQLQQLAFLTGISSSGTKPTLSSRLSTELSAIRDTNQGRTAETPLSTQRILSIDLGLRNLAFCLLEVDVDAHLQRKTIKRSQQGLLSTPDELLTRLSRGGFDENTIAKQDASLSAPAILEILRLHSWRRISLLPKSSNTSSPASDAKATSFSPMFLAPLAYSLIKDVFLPLNPSHVLIERQRYRTGGSAAVQEWTLRVNMLESMLVAMLIALQAHAGGAENLPTVESISPKRVASFWLSDNTTEMAVASKNVKDKPESGKPKGSSSKIEKEAKISLVDDWLRNSSTFSSFAHSEASATRQHFLEVRDVKRFGRRRKSVEQDHGKPTETEDINGSIVNTTDTSTKLDDLADCLLQGIAWLRWEENKQEGTQYIDTNNHDTI